MIRQRKLTASKVPSRYIKIVRIELLHVTSWNILNTPHASAISWLQHQNVKLKYLWIERSYFITEIKTLVRIWYPYRIRWSGTSNDALIWAILEVPTDIRWSWIWITSAHKSLWSMERFSGKKRRFMAWTSRKWIESNSTLSTQFLPEEFYLKKLQLWNLVNRWNSVSGLR